MGSSRFLGGTFYRFAELRENENRTRSRFLGGTFMSLGFRIFSPMGAGKKTTHFKTKSNSIFISWSECVCVCVGVLKVHNKTIS